MATYPNFQNGPGSLQSVTSATNNFGIGYNAGKNITTQQNNFIVGNGSGLNLNTNDNFILGHNSFTNNSISGSSNVAIGNNILESPIPEIISQNIAIGNSTINGSRNIVDCICIGHAVGSTMGSATAGQVFNNIGIGTGTLSGTIMSDVVNIGVDSGGDSRSVSIGSLAGQSGGIENVCVGYRSGRLASGINNVIVGTNAVSNLSCIGSDNVFIGDSCCANAQNIPDQNVVIGASAATNIGTSVDNVIIGFRAAINITTSSNNNVIIGERAGDSITSSCSDNIIIGSFADTVGGVTSSVLAIGNGDRGNLIYGDLSANQRLAFCSGITAPEYAGGTGVIFLAESTVAPTATTVLVNGGGILYVTGNNLRYHAANGTQTTIA